MLRYYEGRKGRRRRACTGYRTGRWFGLSRAPRGECRLEEPERAIVCVCEGDPPVGLGAEGCEGGRPDGVLG